MKLKTIFYILMTVVFLVLTAVIWIYSQHLMAQINEMWGARFAEKQVLFDKQRTLQALMREITLSRQMAAEPALVEMALHEDDPAILQHGLKVLEHYRPKFQDRSVFAAMFKTGHYYFNDAENKHGKPKLRYTLSPNHPDDHWFYRFVDSRLDYEINVNPDSHLGNTKVWINVAIKHNNEVIGLLGSGLDISEFIKESLAVEQPGISNVFIGRDLTIQLYRNDKLTDYANIPQKMEQRNKVDVLLTDPADVEHLREVMRQLEKTPKQTAAFWVTHKDEKHLMGVAYLPEIGWFNLSFMDYQSSTLLRDFGIAPTLSIILMMSLFAIGWMLHRLVLEPVARLKIGMDKVAFGGVNERIDETGKGELPTLARNFNEMTAKLSETTVSRNLLTAEVAERKRIEDELRQQRDINQHYLDTAQTLMVALDGEGKITMINRAAQELLGYTEYELLGRNWFETCLPQPDGMEIVYPVFLRLMTSGIATTNTFENTVLCRDGSQPLIAWHNSCLLDNKGRIIGTLSSGMDITEHKLAEAQKSKSLSLQKATLESTHDAILVVDLDNNWVLHNQRFIDMWHITDEIIAAQDDSVALSYVLDQLECPADFLSKVRELYTNPEANSFDVIKFKDGRTIERNSLPQFVGGKVVGRVWSFRDVTEQRRIQEDLRDSEEKYRILLDESSDPIFSFYPDGQYRYVNKVFAKQVHLKAADIIGKKIWDFFPKAEADQRFENVKYVFQNGVSKEIEVRVSSPEGDVYFLTTANPVLDAQGRVQTVICSSKNITGQKLVEEGLRQAKELAESAARLKDQFVTLISHDLRSPLLSIKGMLDMAQTENHNGLREMDKNRTLERITRSTEGLINLIERLLEHSRLQSGSMKPEMRFINARSLVEEQIGNISHLAHVKNITIQNTLPGSMHLYADPDLYGEVIHNLLSNAIKFTRNGGNVDIFSTDETTVAVRDDGVGIDEKMLPDLFNIGVKTTTYGTDEERGSGLGLPYSHDIMKAHGGSLTAVPVKGAGTKFHVTLPRHDTLVLIVDDQDIQRAIMKEMIAKLNGVQVVEARDGAEALEMLQHITPAIIITDIQMPVMDGFELVRQIRNMPQYEMVPIMAVTAFAGVDSAELREKLLTLGADDFIAKPLAEEAFLPVVARYLGMG